MAKYLTLLIICLGAITSKLFGQKLPSIQLDRPDQTECPFITPKNYIQIENGFTLENKDKNQRERLSKRFSKNSGMVKAPLLI